MPWQVVMEEGGTITLPPDLIAKLGWTTETTLRWTEVPEGVALVPANAAEDEAAA